MPNVRRGEIEAVLDGRPHRLCLTLGALAELEAAFGADDMLALARRFDGGRLSARDLIRIVGAGLRGAGHPIPDEAVALMKADDGLSGFVDIASRLLAITFGSPQSVAGSVRSHERSAPVVEPGGVTEPVPFPGMT